MNSTKPKVYVSQSCGSIATPQNRIEKTTFIRSRVLPFNLTLMSTVKHHICALNYPITLNIVQNLCLMCFTINWSSGQRKSLFCLSLLIYFTNNFCYQQSNKVVLTLQCDPFLTASTRITQQATCRQNLITFNKFDRSKKICQFSTVVSQMVLTVKSETPVQQFNKVLKFNGCIIFNNNTN